MLKITDGNLFEAIRLMLPEHREKMKEVERELQKHARPKLSEDAFQEMTNIFSDCAANGHSVQIALFDEYEDELWTGTPIVRDGRLFLQRGRETWPIPVDRVIHIDPV